MFSILPSGWDQRDVHPLLAPAVPPTTWPCCPASICSWQPPGSRRGLPTSCQLNPTESPSHANKYKWLGSATRVGRRTSRWATWSVAQQGAVTFGKVLWKERTSANVWTTSVGSHHADHHCLRSQVQGSVLFAPDCTRHYTRGAVGPRYLRFSNIQIENYPEAQNTVSGQSWLTWCFSQLREDWGGRSLAAAFTH